MKTEVGVGRSPMSLETVPVFDRLDGLLPAVAELRCLDGISDCEAHGGHPRRLIKGHAYRGGETLLVNGGEPSAGHFECLDAEAEPGSGLFEILEL